MKLALIFERILFSDKWLTAIFSDWLTEYLYLNVLTIVLIICTSKLLCMPYCTTHIICCIYYKVLLHSRINSAILPQILTSNSCSLRLNKLLLFWPLKQYGGVCSPCKITWFSHIGGRCFQAQKNGLRLDKKRRIRVEDTQNTQTSWFQTSLTDRIPQKYIPWHLCHLHGPQRHSWHTYTAFVITYAQVCY